MPKLIFDSTFASEIPPLPALNNAAPRVARSVNYGRNGMCYWNCDDYVAQFGGNILYGWQPSGWPPVIIELLHHAVVETQDGELVDPTPIDELALVTTLFYPDATVVPPRDYPIFIPNKFYSFDGGHEARENMARAHENQMDIKREQIAILRHYGIPWPVESRASIVDRFRTAVAMCS